MLSVTGMVSVLLPLLYDSTMLPVQMPVVGKPELMTLTDRAIGVEADVGPAFNQVDGQLLLPVFVVVTLNGTDCPWLVI